MITTQRYFIHIDNKSVVPWTSEIEDNYKFKEITLKVAMAIERGAISADEVVEQITRQVKPGTLEQMLEAKLKMNVREGNLNLESQIKEDNSQKDTGTAAPYDVTIPGEGAQQAAPADGGGAEEQPAPEKKDASEKKSGKGRGKSKEQPAPEKKDNEAEADAAAEKVASALGENGGVNV